MTQRELKMLQDRAARVVARNADDYAEVLVTEDEEMASVVEVNCVLIFAGYTPAKFMMAWAKGNFDA